MFATHTLWSGRGGFLLPLDQTGPTSLSLINQRAMEPEGTNTRIHYCLYPICYKNQPILLLYNMSMSYTMVVPEEWTQNSS